MPAPVSLLDMTLPPYGPPAPQGDVDSRESGNGGECQRNLEHRADNDGDGNNHPLR